jgi:hypothetical protein
MGLKINRQGTKDKNDILRSIAVKKILMNRFILIFLLFSPICEQAQTILSPDQQEAMQLLNRMDTTKASEYWPLVEPAAFYYNVKRNILYPEKIYQGHVTNFCGYAAMSVILCRQQPQTYVRYIIELYETGETKVDGKVLKPTESVRKTVGNLQRKGRLKINPADQLWLMSLPDQYKGYMNIDKKYKEGDENKIWAACTLGKFNHMASDLGGYKITSYGSDLIRPWGKNNIDFIRKEMNKGSVVLFVNSKFLHPSKFRIMILHAPTHFIIVYDIQEVDSVIELKYWDYGLKTIELMTPKRLKKMTYGIIRLNKENMKP